MPERDGNWVRADPRGAAASIYAMNSHPLVRQYFESDPTTGASRLARGIPPDQLGAVAKALAGMSIGFSLKDMRFYVGGAYRGLYDKKGVQVPIPGETAAAETSGSGNVAEQVVGEAPKKKKKKKKNKKNKKNKKKKGKKPADEPLIMD